MTAPRTSHDPPLTRLATAPPSLLGGSLLVSALAQFSLSADTSEITSSFFDRAQTELSNMTTHLSCRQQVSVYLRRGLQPVDGQRKLQPEAGNQPAINSNEEQCPLCHEAGLASL